MSRTSAALRHPLTIAAPLLVGLAGCGDADPGGGGGDPPDEWLLALEAEARATHPGVGDLHVVALSPQDDIQAKIDALPAGGALALVYLRPGEYRGQVNLTRANTELAGCTAVAGAAPTCFGALPAEPYEAAVITRADDETYTWGQGIVEIEADDVRLARVTIDGRYSELPEAQDTDPCRRFNAVAINACDRGHALDEEYAEKCLNQAPPPRAACEPSARIENALIEDIVTRDLFHIDLNLNHCTAIVRRSVLAGAKVAGIFASGSPQGGHIVIQDNVITGKDYWTALGLQPLVWNRSGCNPETGDCAFGPSSLTVEISGNRLEGRAGITLELGATHRQGSLAPGPHSMDITATGNTFVVADTPMELWHRQWTGSGMTVSTVLRANSATVAPLEPDGVRAPWSLLGADAEGQYPSDTHLAVVDEDGILAPEVVGAFDCGDATNSIELRDGEGALVKSCPPIVD